MYMKVVYKRLHENGDCVMEYRMVENCRSGLTVKQQVILHLGRLSKIPLSEQKIELGIRINQFIKCKVTGQQDLFTCTNIIGSKIC